MKIKNIFYSFKRTNKLSPQEKTIWVNRNNLLSVDDAKELGIKSPRKVASNVSKKLKVNIKFVDNILIIE